MATQILFPVGRLVGGSLHKGSTTNKNGEELVYKKGPDAGKPRVDFWFAVALQKSGEPHWNQTAWGQQVWAAAMAAWPQGQFNAPTFKWKVIDGDSAVPSDSGNKPCEAEGYPGHWVVRFSGTYAPKLVDAKGQRELGPSEVVKPGYYVQVYGDVSSNAPAPQPGMYLNHRVVAFSAFGPEIIVGPDASSLGFGAGPLPVGASAAPMGMPSAVPPVVMPAPVAVAPNPAAVAVAPNPAFLQVPVPPVAPVPRLVLAPHMTAAGHTVESMRAGGWTDQMMIDAKHAVMA